MSVRSNWHNIRYMPDDGFAEIQRKLETIASELKTATVSAQRRELLRVMSRLVVEADAVPPKVFNIEHFAETTRTVDDLRRVSQITGGTSIQIADKTAVPTSGFRAAARIVGLFRRVRKLESRIKGGVFTTRAFCNQTVFRGFGSVEPVRIVVWHHP